MYTFRYPLLYINIPCPHCLRSCPTHNEPTRSDSSSSRNTRVPWFIHTWSCAHCIIRQQCIIMRHVVFLVSNGSFVPWIFVPCCCFIVYANLDLTWPKAACNNGHHTKPILSPPLWWSWWRGEWSSFSKEDSSMPLKMMKCASCVSNRFIAQCR